MDGKVDIVAFISRYEGKGKTLMYDVTKIVSALKGKRGDHRAFRLAENLCMNLILSLRDPFQVKKEGKVDIIISELQFFVLLLYLTKKLMSPTLLF